jgi:hypothetical protein
MRISTIRNMLIKGINLNRARKRRKKWSIVLMKEDNYFQAKLLLNISQERWALRICFDSFVI